MEVSTTGGTQLDRLSVLSSKPGSTSSWTASAIVSGAGLTGSNKITVQAYALCSQ